MCVSPNYTDFVKKTRLLYTGKPYEETKSPVKEETSTYTLTVDKLEFEINSSEEINERKKYVFNNVAVTPSKSKDRNYEYTYTVTVNNRPIGTLFSTPEVHVLNTNRLAYKFTVTNHILYQSNCVNLLTTFFDSIKAKEVLNKVDIAYDSMGLIDRINELRNEGYELKKAYTPKALLKKDLTTIVGIKLGSESSSKTWSIYSKSKDITNTEKRYIKDFHLLNGLTGDNVDRVELRLKTKKEIQSIQFDWKKINSTTYLGNAFKSYAEKDLQFINKKEYTYTSTRNKKYNMKPLIELSQYMSIDKENEITVIDMNYANKITAKSLYKSYLKHEDSHYYDSLRAHLIHSRLVDWFITSQRVWTKRSQLIDNEQPMTKEIEAIISDLKQQVFLDSLVLNN